MTRADPCCWIFGGFEGFGGGGGQAWPQQAAGSGEACVHQGPGVANDSQTDASEFRDYGKGSR